MNTYAIVDIGGTQLKVTPGGEFLVQFLSGDPGKKIELGKVLLLSEDNKISVGTPYLTGQKLEAVIVSQEKGPKVKVSKFKAKSRYQKEIGFRAKLTLIKVQEFGQVSKTESAKIEKTLVAETKPKKKVLKK